MARLEGKAKLPTEHAKRRMSERWGGCDSIALANGARHCGLGLNDIENWERCDDGFELKKLKSYIQARESHQGKNVKLYDGFCFIFMRTSGRLITMYKIENEDVLEEYKNVHWIEKRKREKYRRMRRGEQ